MKNFNLTTCQGDQIEVHAAGCADIAKKARQGKFYNGTDTIEFLEGTSERDVWIDFNIDFLDESGEEGAWPLKFYPCCHGAGLVKDEDRSWN